MGDRRWNGDVNGKGFDDTVMMKAIDAAAVILRNSEGLFLMQLRDNIDSIVYPNCWGLFGGSLEAQESACAAAFRELQEEINYLPDEVYEIKQCFHLDQQIMMFFASIDVPVSDLDHQEGADIGFFSFENIVSGKLFSEKTQSYHVVPEALIEMFEDYQQWMKIERQ